MRLGEILLAAGVVDATQLAAAFRQQIVYGGRLGTNLIELGYADPDQIARGLAHQHGVPAALRRHVERHDPEVLAIVPRALAASTMAVPIAYSMASGKRLVVCMRDPTDVASASSIAESARIRVVPCVASELVVAALLERCYHIARPRRFAHAAHGAAAPLPGSNTGPITVPEVDPEDDSIDIDFDSDDRTPMPEELQLVELDDHAVVRDLSQYSQSSRDRVHAIAGTLWASASAMEGLDLATQAQTGIEQAIAAVSAITGAEEGFDISGTVPISAEPPPRRAPTEPPDPEATLQECLEAMQRAVDRDAVDQAVLRFMHGRFEGGVILLAKDGLALGSRGFGGLFDDISIQSVVIPLSVPSVFQRAHDQRMTVAGRLPPEGAAIHERFLRLFDLAEAPPVVVVTPVCIRERVVCLLYGHARDATGVKGLEKLAEAAAATFVGLIKASKRSDPAD